MEVHHPTECPDCGDRVENALRILRKVYEEGEERITAEQLEDIFMELAQVRSEFSFTTLWIYVNVLCCLNDRIVSCAIVFMITYFISTNNEKKQYFLCPY